MVKKKSEDSFCCTFKPNKDKKLLYTAVYSSGNLNVFKYRHLSKDRSIPFKQELKNKDAWNAFYNYATFEDILNDIKPPQPKWNNLDKLKASNPQEFLEQIRDEPYSLTNPQVLVSFVKILTDIKYIRNQDKRKNLRDALYNYFLPKFKTSNKPIQPPIKLPLELLIKLAERLSEKCNNVLHNQRYEKSDCIRKSGIIKDDCYKTIMRWASKYEPRICRVKPTGTKAMIESKKQISNTSKSGLIRNFEKAIDNFVDVDDNYTFPDDLKEKYIREFKKYVRTIKIEEPARNVLDDYALNEKDLSLLIDNPQKYAKKRLSSHLDISLSTMKKLLK